MTYRIITVPGTDPVAYHVQYEYRTWPRQRLKWGTMGHLVHYGEAWYPNVYGSVEKAQKDIAHWNRQEANATAAVVGDADETDALKELDCEFPGVAVGEFKP